MSRTRNGELLYRFMRRVPEPDLRRQYRRRLWRIVAGRREPSLAFLYVLRCAIHYHNWRLAKDKARPELLGMVTLWANETGEEFASALNGVHNAKAKCEALLAAAKASRTDLAPTVIRTIGGDLALNTLLTDAASTDVTEISVWLAEAANQADRSVATIEARLLDDARPLSYKMLRDISRLITVDEPFDSAEREPWGVAWACAVGEADETVTNELLVYLFMRSLGRGTKFPAELLALTFEGVLAAVVGKTLASPLLSPLEKRLSRGSVFDRSNGHRVVRTVAETFVRKDLSPKVFMSLTQDVGIFAELSREALRNYGGRKFLKGVGRQLQVSSRDGGKRNVIERILEYYV